MFAVFYGFIWVPYFRWDWARYVLKSFEEPAAAEPAAAAKPTMQPPVDKQCCSKDSVAQLAQLTAAAQGHSIKWGPLVPAGHSKAKPEQHLVLRCKSCG